MRRRLPSAAALSGCHADAVTISEPPSTSLASSGSFSGGYVQSLSIVQTTGELACANPVRNAAPRPRFS